MIMQVNRRHKSEGGKYRVTEKKGAASAKGESKMDQGRKCEEGKQRITGENERHKSQGGK